MRPAVGEGRQHGVQPHAAGEQAVDPGLCVVEPPAGDPGKAHGQGPQVVTGTRTAARSTPPPRSTHTTRRR